MSKMKSNKVYFPVYKSIEEEVLKLATSIHFTDEQINVYSLKIADLILRASIELESLAKDIYRNEVKREPSSPGECINWLEENRKISKKSLSVVSQYFYFDTSFSPNFCPFNYKNDSDDDYYAQYNAIKHDRVKNLGKANINTLIRVLGALFILNVYYKDLKVSLNDDYTGEKFDRSGGSEIFNFLVYPSEEASMLIGNKGIELDSCIYKIEKHYGQFCFNMIFVNEKGDIRAWNCIMGNTPFQDFAKSKQGQKLSLDEFFEQISKIIDIDIEEQKQSLFRELKIKQVIEIKGSKMRDSYWAVLNQ